MSLHKLREEDMPREKLERLGVRYLTNRELVAIIFSRGTRKENVFRLADRVISSYGDFAFDLGTRDAGKLSEILDIPKYYTMKLVALLELAERIYSGPRNFTIRSPQDAFTYLGAMRNLRKEHLRGLYLDARNGIMRDEVLSIGTVTSSISTPREIFAPALEIGAISIILAHNHPSGDPTPSREDIEFTRTIKTAGDILGVELLDHLIIAREGYTSFREKKLI